jgi:hypothetical protein
MSPTLLLAIPGLKMRFVVPLRELPPPRNKGAQRIPAARNLKGTRKNARRRPMLEAGRMRRLDIMIDPQTNPEQAGVIPVLPTLDGTPFDFESLRGKRVLLFMWGSW